ncbi:MAG TPA: MATE family efflux transporter [Lachnospiraceae bacterium]|nr:MATE family efflux transporter [Lachnospiraceae bacterium]
MWSVSTKEKKELSQEAAQIDWKDFYRRVLALVIPMALQNLINVGVTAADVFMLGKLGETALSGASLAGQVQFIMTLVFFGLTSGATVLTAQYWGKGDRKTIEKILGMAMKFSLITAAIFTAAAFLIPETLMHIYTSEPDVIAEGVKYLRIVGWSYLFMAFTQVYLNIMRSIEKVVIATVVYSVSLGVNVCINAVLIFGLFGFPKMGIIGAAIGTLAARVAELLIVVWYASVKNKIIHIRLRYLLRSDKILLKDFMVYALPVVLNEMMWGLGSSANTAVIGHLGSAAVAANSVAQVARQLATVVAFGICNATAVYLGKTIGEKKYGLAKIYAKKFIRLSLITGGLGAAVILLSTPVINHTMSLTVQAQSYLSFMFFVMSYFTVAQALNTTLVVGIFRSGGDTRFGLALDVSTMWGCSILLGAAAAFLFNAPVQIVYMLLMSDEVIKVPLTLKRFFSYKWLKDVTRDF